MPIPGVLNDPITYGQVWTGVLTVGQNVRNPQRAGGVVTKTFRAYVENYEQSAHDRAMAAYVQRLGGRPRSPHRAQVNPANNNPMPLAYYATHGQVASGLVAAEMQQRWTAAAAAGGNATVFQPGQARTLTVQGIRQPDGYHYEVTMWYDVNDVYVAFHCYHP
jgi:hypothetical protein